MVKKENIYRKLSVRINSSLNALLSVLKGGVTNCFKCSMPIKNKTLFSVILCIHCVLHVVGCIDKHTKIVKIKKWTLPPPPPILPRKIKKNRKLIKKGKEKKYINI